MLACINSKEFLHRHLNNVELGSSGPLQGSFDWAHGLYPSLPKKIVPYLSKYNLKFQSFISYNVQGFPIYNNDVS